MKNKFMIKAGSLLLAGVMMTPLFVSADSQTCTGTARYYFSQEEVIEDCGGKSGKKYSDYREKCANTVNSAEEVKNFHYNEITGGAYEFGTIFPQLDQKYKITNAEIVTDIDDEQVKEWLDAVYETIDTIGSSGAIVKSNDNNEKYIYLHGDWSQTDINKGKVHINEEGNPVYEAGIVRGLKEFDGKHTSSNLYDQFVSEVANSNIQLQPADYESVKNGTLGVGINGYNTRNNSMSIARYYNGYSNLRNVEPVDLSKWSIFQHYDKNEDCFINPVTATCFKEGDVAFKSLDYTVGDDLGNVSSVYIDWLYDSNKDESYQKYINTCNADGSNYGNEEEKEKICRTDGGYGEKSNVDGIIKIWTPGGSTWINNIVYVDKTYTYDCSTDDGGYVDEPEQNSPQTGIPSYGYLAIILAGAAGVYVIAKKRNKFIKF